MYATTSILLGKYAIGKGRTAVEDMPLWHQHTSSEQLATITSAAQETLMTATSVFPLVFFPDTINIDRRKLTIARRTFFRTASIASVQIADILNVEANIGPFFGSITVTSRYFQNNTQSIKYLKRADVIKIQRLLQGYMIAHQAKIDCATIEKSQLIALLNNLGQGSSN